MSVADPTIAHASVDRDGRLTTIDGAFADLNERAGGKLGLPIAVPQVASLARLAGRLGILISRSVLAADGDEDVTLWVRAQPSDEGVRLALSGWQRRAAWQAAAAPARPAAGKDSIAWETDAALRLSFIAVEAAAHYGIEAASALGRPLPHLFGIGEDEGGSRALAAAIGDNAPFDGEPATIRFSRRRIMLSAAPRHDPDGRFAGYAGTARVTDDAPVAERAPDEATLPPDFAVTMARVLRGPLGRIVANADSINAQMEGPIASDYAGYAADIANAGRHLLGLVEDLADVQAIEQADFRIAPERVDLADVARRAAGLLQMRAAERHIRIIRPDDDVRLFATGEFRRVLQILVNLIGNAVRYSRDGSAVDVRCERDEGEVRVIVRDSGKGIAEEDQRRIFDKFERVDPGEAGGSGLGLYIARRLARAMAGDVTVRSAPGNGATFILTLPARDASADQPGG